MTIRVQMPEGTSSVSVAGQEYTPDEDGIVSVEHPEHVGPLVSAGGVEIDADGSGMRSGLIGSSHQPSEIDDGEGNVAALGQLVTEAFNATGVSVDQWNNLPPSIREMIIGWRVAAHRGEFASQTEVSELRQRIAELEQQLADASTEDAGDAGAGDGTDADAGEGSGEDEAKGPDFDAMTMTQIQDWIVENGGEKPQGNKEAFVAAAQALLASKKDTAE